MQSMVTAVFTRLRQLPASAEEELAANSLSRIASSADLVETDRHNSSGLRMTAPDPGSIDVPAATNDHVDSAVREGQGGEAEPEPEHTGPSDGS